LVISRVRKFCSLATTSRFWCLSSPFLRDYGLVMFFAFLRYSYREGVVWLACSSLLIRLSLEELIGYILALKESVLSSARIWGLRYSGCSSV